MDIVVEMVFLSDFEGGDTNGTFNLVLIKYYERKKAL